MKYLAIIVKRGNGYSAFAPDLPGCVAAGDTHEETDKLIRQAVVYHLELMADSGEPIPEPASTALEVEVERLKTVEAGERWQLADSSALANELDRISDLPRQKCRTAPVPTA